MEREHQDFRDAFATGRLSESRIARWLIHEEHWNVLPAYDLELATGKGPRLFTPDGELVVPDLLAMKLHGGECLLAWYEAKHKTRFTWYRRAQSWQTGIDLRHYLDYLMVQEQTQREVYLCFFHEGSTPSVSDRANGSPSAGRSVLVSTILACAHGPGRPSRRVSARWTTIPDGVLERA